MDLETVFSVHGKLSDEERTLIGRAYQFAKDAHGDCVRKSGEPYITHPLNVACLLAELKMDAPTLAAALLHDVVEDTSITLADLEREFGAEVAKLVDGVTKVEKLPTEVQKTGKDYNKEAEFLRKTFLAMGNDIRVILIKLADRLHNMRTLAFLSAERQKRMAKETMEIFAPLANRLGIWQYKWELEDLSFRYLQPEKYREIEDKIAEARDARADYLKRHSDMLRAQLTKHGIVGAQISGRPKHIYSIHRKMERKKLPFEQIYDVRALRVIVPDAIACYTVLGIVHSLWNPIHSEMDDYIAKPKDNFYQSLHTAVADEDGKTLEVQIRTPEMHEHAEFGVAAHWRYKEGVKYDAQFEKRIEYIRRMMEKVGEEDIAPDAAEYVEAMKSDVLPEERIYAFTPKNNVIDLPAGSTPIDFAYAIHSEIGDRCRGARVNGAMVNLDYKLKNGDHVEIITAKRGGPSRDWLSGAMGYTKTTRAQAKIRNYFRRQGREQNIAQGREVIERELKRLGFAEYSREELAKRFNDSTEDFYAKIGFGDISMSQIAAKLEDVRKAARDLHPTLPPPRLNSPMPAPVKADDGINVLGDTGMLINLARCCSPTQGDMIVGFITRGKGITVHRADCPNVINSSERDRLINVNWGRETGATYPVLVNISAMDREGLLNEITGVVADEGVNISNLNVNTDNGLASIVATLSVENTAQLSRLLERIEKKVPNVFEARRSMPG